MGSAAVQYKWEKNVITLAVWTAGWAEPRTGKV